MQLHVVRMWTVFYVDIKDMVVGGGNLGFMLLRHFLAGIEEWRVR